MKKSTTVLFFLMTLIISLVSLSYCSKHTTQDTMMINQLNTIQDIALLFALDEQKIHNNTQLYIQEAQRTIDEIIAIAESERTFLNTAQLLDELLALSNLAISQHIFHALEMLSPDAQICSAAHEAAIEIQKFWDDQIKSNKKLCDAFMAYTAQQKENEHLSDQQRYFLNDIMALFKREGLSLSDDQLDMVRRIRNDLSVLTSNFDRNIAQDNRFITVSREELSGLEDDFIASLQRSSGNDLYRVGVDYPTYNYVMENCTNVDTRKALYVAFNNRGYPQNDDLLQRIIIERHKLAQALGYLDYAHYDIDNEMVHTPERAHDFIVDLHARCMPKVMEEKSRLTAVLPESVVLDEQSRIYPWDFAYLENSYKKQYCNIDEEKIAEYFPMQKTVDELLDIYRQFFGVEFKQLVASGFWHEDVMVIQVWNKAGDELLGTLLLDLYPRDNKYNHAAQMTMVPATFKSDGTRRANVSIVIANFSKPTDMQPSLLKRNEVKTFFHEFGHALHAVLGASSMASLAGTATKTDFVELPSQMLEEWLWNKDILKKVSGHYQTGQPLPDAMIDAIVAVKDLTSGYFVMRQSYLSMMSLMYFGVQTDKNPKQIMKELHERMMSDVVAYSEENNFYASFGHLTGYGAKYYGYLWSKVFALDLFAEIKKHGLLDPVIGHKYVAEVLGKGGAQDPNELLYNFLGREPNTRAFFSEMGLR